MCGCQLEQPVRCAGNVEVWLGDLLVQQMRALHTIIRLASQVINDPDFQLLTYINESIAQVAALIRSVPTPIAVAAGGDWVISGVCMFVYQHDISKSNAAGNTKLDVQMFHDVFWKPIYFGFRRSKVQAMSQENIAAGCVCKPRWVFSVAVSRRASRASNTGFSLRHFHASAAAGARH